MTKSSRVHAASTGARDPGDRSATTQRYEVYGCCGKEFAGEASVAQRLVLEHIHGEHGDDPSFGADTDAEHLERTRF